MNLSGMDFEKVWAALRISLHPPQKIRNWTALRGYLGDTMTVVAVHGTSIEVAAPKAKSIQVVHQDDFEAVFNVWKAYKEDRVQRQEIRELTRYSKYVISILHWLESEEK